MIDRKQKLTRMTAKILAMLLMLAAFMPLMHTNNAYAESLDELKQQKKEIQDAIAANEAAIVELDQDKAEMQALMADLNSQYGLAQEELDKLYAELEQANNNMRAAIKLHEDSILDLNNKQEEYEKRITSLFKIRHKSTLEVLLESDSIDGFFTNMKLMGYIGQVDQSMITQLDMARQQAEESRKNREQTKAEYDAFVEAKQKDIENIKNGMERTQNDIESYENKILTRSAEVTKLSHQEQETTDAIDAIMKEQERLAAEARARAEEEARRNQSTYSPPADYEMETRKALDGSEALIYPLANYRRLSDGYGWRPDPFSGTGSYMHWGIDFPAPAGTPIRAALSGKVVVYSSPNQGSVYGGGGFGNYCSILSDNGIMLIYAHQTEVWAKLGQYVQQGEVIGCVGSTGFSTGSHLHFQMRVPWSSASGIDPMPYLP